MITIREFIQHLETSDANSPSLYLAEWRGFQAFPELLAEIDYANPGVFDPRQSSPPVLYMGGPASFTPLHFDYAPNLTAQIRGQKRWVFFPPTQTKLLYPYPSASKLAHFSMANSLSKLSDSKQFPMLSRAKKLEVVLEEGDILYVPPYWWHHVYGVSNSISLNFFWKPLPLLIKQIAALPLNKFLDRTHASDVPINWASLNVALVEYFKSRLKSRQRLGN